MKKIYPIIFLLLFSFSAKAQDSYAFTLDEAIQAIYNNLDKVSPRDLSAFWTVVPKLLKYRQNRGHLAPQLEAIFNKTAMNIGNYGIWFLFKIIELMLILWKIFQRNMWTLEPV